MIKILIAEDQVMLLSALANLLDLEEGIEVLYKSIKWSRGFRLSN